MSENKTKLFECIGCEGNDCNKCCNGCKYKTTKSNEFPCKDCKDFKNFESNKLNKRRFRKVFDDVLEIYNEEIDDYTFPSCLSLYQLQLLREMIDEIKNLNETIKNIKKGE